MSRYHLEIRVTPRPGILDPEGQAVHHALHALGYADVAAARVGKAIYLETTAESEAQAVERAEEMCRKLLANPVTEDFSVAVVEEDLGRQGAGRPGSAAGTAGAGHP